MAQYNELAKIGFRRSGENVYRPHCSVCGLCIPVRVNVNTFTANRSQRRNLKLNTDLDYQVKDPEFEDEHYDLYRRYMKDRHAGGGMDNDEPESYENLIKSSWCNSKLLEFRQNEKLVMIAVIDCFNDGISAVYTFYDPEYNDRGLGVFGVLSEIAFIKSQHKQWLYLGYWNPKTTKMAYKIHYQPMEFFDGQHWQDLAKK
jgi:arginine-tRNA-protein transferase